MNQWYNPSNHDPISPNHLRFRIEWGRLGAQNIDTLSESGEHSIEMKENQDCRWQNLGKGRGEPPSQLGHGSNMALPMPTTPPHLISPWALVTVTLLKMPSHWNISRFFSHPYNWSFCSLFLKCPALYTHKHYLSRCSSINIPLKYSPPSPGM